MEKLLDRVFCEIFYDVGLESQHFKVGLSNTVGEQEVQFTVLTALFEIRNDYVDLVLTRLNEIEGIHRVEDFSFKLEALDQGNA